MTTLKRIISGGQTGVDRGALDAALQSNFPCGGWCPANRMAEDGAIPTAYPLVVLPDAGYPERTRNNVRGSDATVILAPGRLSGGTRLTQVVCVQFHRPCLVIDAGSTSVEDAAAEIAGFVDTHDVHTLNVAGPRASRWINACTYARHTILLLLQR